jgi:hypothetical protein
MDSRTAWGGTKPVDECERSSQGPLGWPWRCSKLDGIAQMSKDGSPKRIAAYGSLYLDRGERMKVVKDQIKVLARESPNSPFFFDVIYGPGQDALATEYAERVRRFADRFTFTEINVGTSFAEAPQADPRHSTQSDG